MRRLTLIDLFSGAGGLSAGLMQAGFTPVAASELVDAYAGTYEANHPSARMYRGDIRKLSCDRVLSDLGLTPGELDLLAGGPPCQGFSVNSHIRGLTDDRNHLFYEFLRFTEYFKPKAILIENVPGIVQMDNGAVVRSIYQALSDLGYTVGHMILYAAHYGVPQMRWRTIFMAVRNGVQMPHFPRPTHRAESAAHFKGKRQLSFSTPPQNSLFDEPLLPHTTIADAISDLPPLTNGGGINPIRYDCSPQSKYQWLLREHSSKIHNHSCSKLHAINVERMKHVQPGGSWRDIPRHLLSPGMQRARTVDHTRRYGRLSPDGLCSTILTKCDPHWGSYIHYDQDRILSVREAARIQSFPDRFVFTGSIVHQYQQVGNAVPPLLAVAVGREIAGVLDLLEDGPLRALTAR